VRVDIEIGIEMQPAGFGGKKLKRKLGGRYDPRQWVKSYP